jgi:thioredoxin 1
MAEADDIEEIREQKKRELRGEAPVDGDAGAGASGAPDEPLHVSGLDGFQQVVEAYDVVLVDFYADWCGPCKQLAPVVERLAATTDAAVAKVDIDQNPGLAQRFGVQSVPTLLLFSDGEAVEQTVGFQGEDALRRLIQRHA